jgi:hypothetical protein
MKKQNANNILAFNKSAITELNDAESMGINGGTSPLLHLAAMSLIIYFME